MRSNWFDSRRHFYRPPFHFYLWWRAGLQHQSRTTRSSFHYFVPPGVFCTSVQTTSPHSRNDCIKSCGGSICTFSFLFHLPLSFRPASPYSSGPLGIHTLMLPRRELISFSANCLVAHKGTLAYMFCLSENKECAPATLLYVDCFNSVHCIFVEEFQAQLKQRGSKRNCECYTWSPFAHIRAMVVAGSAHH